MEITVWDKLIGAIISIMIAILSWMSVTTIENQSRISVLEATTTNAVQLTNQLNVIEKEIARVQKDVESLQEKIGTLQVGQKENTGALRDLLSTVKRSSR